MAKQLKNFNFPEPTVYDWNKWTDTHAWEIVQGEDYSVSTESMRTNLYDKARALGRSVRTQTVKTEDGREGLRFQFFHPDAARPPRRRRSQASAQLLPANDPRRFE